ncbi:MAG: hypothetical protein IJ088_02610 [Clostridia bacterium]|nr:hypothetical protein [Clostridia bacterium]
MSGPGPMGESGAAPDPHGPPEGAGQTPEIVYYDSLDAVLMALQLGEIDSIEIYQSVAQYLRATNENIRLSVEYDLTKERNRVVDGVIKGVLSSQLPTT